MIKSWRLGLGGRVWGELSVSGLLGFPGYPGFFRGCDYSLGRVSNQIMGHLCIVEGKGRKGKEERGWLLDVKKIP